MIRNLTILVLAVTVIGCASSRNRPVALYQTDVISMTKAGATDEEIMRRIDETRTVFNLSADDVVLLRKEGVSGRVVTYMLETVTRAAVADERRRNYYDSRWNFGIGYGHWHRW